MRILSSICVLALVVGGRTNARAAAPDSASTYPSEEALSRYAAGLSLEVSGETAEAMREFFRALALDPKSVAIARRLSDLSARAGDAARSLEFANRGLTNAPGDARLLWLKGAALFNLGRAAEALGALTAAVDADSQDAEFTRTLARVADHLGRGEVVADAWRRTAALDPDDGEAWFQLASARARIGDFDAADRSLAQAAQVSPTRPGLTFMQGWIREGQGRRLEAIDLYRKHLEVHRGDTSTRRRFVELLAREKRWDEAYREAERVSQAERGDFAALEVQADLAFRSKRSGDARRLVQELRAGAGDDDRRRLGLIILLARNGRGREGIDFADEWARAAEASAGHMLAAKARAIAGDTAGAIARAVAGTIAAPDSVRPRVLLAQLYQSGGRYESAESAWTGALAAGADSGMVLLEIAFCREQRGDITNAVVAARDALRRDPGNPRMLNFLGYLLADANQSLEEALDLIRRALTIDLDNGAYVDSLGWVYYRLGRLDEARAELERAIKLTGGDPVVQEHLGDVYVSLKLFDLAREQYRRSLSANSSNAKIKAKLASIR